MKVEPQKEHAWLQQLVGDWTTEGECVMGPDQPPMRWTARESVRSVGGVWVLCEGVAEMPEGDVHTTQMTLGFDPRHGRFVGTFIGSMMTNLWVYDGGLDAAGRVLTLDAEGPSFADPTKTAKYQDIIEVQGDGRRTLSSQFLGDDGRWTRFMTMHYRRTK